MSKRLQVLVEEQELRDIRKIARRHRMTVAEWVRQALRVARRGEPLADARKKLAVIKESARCAFPVADIEQLLAEIERGYIGERDR